MPARAIGASRYACVLLSHRLIESRASIFARETEFAQLNEQFKQARLESKSSDVGRPTASVESCVTGLLIKQVFEHR
jgi:hypothetical protein